MKPKKILIIIALALAALLIFATANASRPVISRDNVSWELTQTKIIDPGKVTQMEEGVFTNGITLQAKVKSRGGNVIPKGDFILKFDVFAPNRDLPAQKAGFWYVYGEWTITREGASSLSKQARHSPDLVKGVMMTELPFNPLERGNWTAAASLPMSTAAGRWSSGEGTLTFNAALEGDLYLALKQWPDAQGR